MCKKEYVGETSHALGLRFNEHTDCKRSSAVWDHIQETGHEVRLEDVKILGQDEKDQSP